MSASEAVIQCYVDARMPAIRDEFARQTAAGAAGASLMGVISDGKGRLREMADVMPLEVAQAMIQRLNVPDDEEELATLAQISRTILSPPPGLFLTMFFVEGSMGLVGHEIGTVKADPDLTPEVTEDGDGNMRMNVPALLRWLFELDASEMSDEGKRRRVESFQARARAHLEAGRIMSGRSSDSDEDVQTVLLQMVNVAKLKAQIRRGDTDAALNVILGSLEPS